MITPEVAPTQHSNLAFCVIGAGPSGLTALKNLLQAGISAVCLEREGDLGGNWAYGQASSSVYDSAHLISSKRLTEYTDHPMPRGWPAYPNHRQALEYLQGYAERFDLRRHIHFGVEVERVERNEAEGLWQVHSSRQADPEPMAGVVIANGHHWDPLWPELPGEFDGEIIHARAYKTPAQLAGRRVLVIGAGNTGCDLAVEAAQHARSATLSMRRGYHFLPKFLLGKPVDQCGERLHRLRLPLVLQRAIATALVRVAVGPLWRYGLPTPDHRLFESHPIINSQLPYYAGHGDVQIKGDVSRLAGRQVRFADGSEQEFDLIICATGYKISFPFLEQRYLGWNEGRPRLYLNAFHPEYDDLFLAGLIQPNSGQWRLTDLQSQLFARFTAACRRGTPEAAWFRQLKTRPDESLSAGIRYLASPRHALEVEYFSYRRRLAKLIARFPPAEANGRG